MQEEPGLTPAQRELESALKSVSPAAGRVDPLAAAFSAGRHSARRQARFWQSAALLLLAAGAGSWLAPAWHGGVQRGQDLPGMALVVRHESPRVPPVSDQSLLVLQAAISRKGADALPVTHLPSIHDVQSIETF